MKVQKTSFFLQYINQLAQSTFSSSSFFIASSASSAFLAASWNFLFRMRNVLSYESYSSFSSNDETSGRNVLNALIAARWREFFLFAPLPRNFFTSFFSENCNQYKIMLFFISRQRMFLCFSNNFTSTDMTKNGSWSEPDFSSVLYFTLLFNSFNHGCKLRLYSTKYNSILNENENECMTCTDMYMTCIAIAWCNVYGHLLGFIFNWNKYRLTLLI